MRSLLHFPPPARPLPSTVQLLGACRCRGSQVLRCVARAASDAACGFSRFPTAVSCGRVRAHAPTPGRKSTVPGRDGGARPRLVANASGRCLAVARRKCGHHVADAARSAHSTRRLGPLATRTRGGRTTSLGINAAAAAAAAAAACRGRGLAPLWARVKSRCTLCPPHSVGRGRRGRLRARQACPFIQRSRTPVLVFRLHVPAHRRRGRRRARAIHRGLADRAHELHAPPGAGGGRHRAASCPAAPPPPRASRPRPRRFHRFLFVLHLKVLLRRRPGQN